MITVWFVYAIDLLVLGFIYADMTISLYSHKIAMILVTIADTLY